MNLSAYYLLLYNIHSLLLLVLFALLVKGINLVNIRLQFSILIKGKQFIYYLIFYKLKYHQNVFTYLIYHNLSND